MVATWLSGHARAVFLLLAFVGCGEAFTGGGNEAGEAGASGTGDSGTGGAGATGKGGSSGSGATSGQGGTSGSAGSAGTGGASGAGADGGEAGSDAGTGGAGTGGGGVGGDSGSGNAGGTSGAGTGGIAGVAGVGGIAGTGGIEPDVPKEGLVLWLRADAGITLTDEHHVLAWADQSGNGNDAEQTGSDEQPELVERENGTPYVVFDGMDDFMRLPAGFSDFGNGLSAFVVNNARSLGYCWALLELSNGVEIDDIFVGHYAMSPHYEVLDTYLTQGEYPFPDDVVISAVHYPNKVIEMRANGSLAGDTSMDLPANVERSQNFLGRSQYANCGVLEGSISEVLLYDRAVSTEELLAIEDYLATRWGCCRE